MTLHELVRRRIEGLGVSQRQVAIKADLSPSKLCSYLSGKKQLRTGSLNRILDALGGIQAIHLGGCHLPRARTRQRKD